MQLFSIGKVALIALAICFGFLQPSYLHLSRKALVHYDHFSVNRKSTLCVYVDLRSIDTDLFYKSKRTCPSICGVGFGSAARGFFGKLLTFRLVYLMKTITVWRLAMTKFCLVRLNLVVNSRSNGVYE